MLAVRRPPPTAPLDEIERAVASPPSSVWGKSIEWKEVVKPRLVYVDSLTLKSDRVHLDVHLFATKYDIGQALFDGRSYGHGFVVEYVIGTVTADALLLVHRLVQCGGDSYASLAEKGDSVPSRDVKDKDKLSLHGRPRWKASEARWPTLRGEPMLFVGQTYIPKTRVATKYLSAGVNVYVFWRRVHEVDHFKIYHQRADQQTAEEHYAQEAGDVGFIDDDE